MVSRAPRLNCALAGNRMPMSDEQLTKVHIDLPDHWATGGESLWARQLGDDRFRDVREVRARLDKLESAAVLSYETCEARMPGSFDDVPEDKESGERSPAS